MSVGRDGNTGDGTTGDDTTGDDDITGDNPNARRQKYSPVLYLRFQPC